jgi:DNA modification methylase
MIEVIHGDCAQVLPTLRAASFDSLITDPPASIGFMGQAWDGDRGGRREWCAWLAGIFGECLRVLKPGAHGLVWAIPRRSHWTALALEDAGFEIPDCINHYFLTGFPKSLDVAKAIDKELGVEREVIGSRRANDIRDRQLVGSKKSMIYEYTAAASPEAKRWNGWGTHLKPAIEHWWLVRKPLAEKTVAANVRKWGTGALNLAASRIMTQIAKSAPPNLFAGTRHPSHFIVSDSELLGAHAGFFHPPIYSPKARPCRGKGNYHPTVKPVELMKYFITLLTQPGGHVLDCFAGSFSLGVAAQLLGFPFTGIELEPAYVEIGMRRLAA